MRWTYPLFFVSTLLLVLLLLSGQGSSLKMTVQESPILRVPYDYNALQAAINAAPEGATIQIAPGTYVGNLTINKSVRLEGSGTEATFLEPILGFRDPDRYNPIITVRSNEGQDIKLSLVNLTLRQPSPSSNTSYNNFYDSFDEAVGIRVEGPDDSVSILAEGTYWIHLEAAIVALPTGERRLHRLEIRESRFERNDESFLARVQEAEIMHNIFVESDLSLHGQRLHIARNTVTRFGIDLSLDPDGVGEVVSNLVAAGGSIVITQKGERATWSLRKNTLISTFGISLRAESAKPPHFDVFIEENNITEGNIGIEINLPAEKGARGKIRLRKNNIVVLATGLRKAWIQSEFFLWGHGISIWSKSVTWPTEPLSIEINDNWIDSNEGWGVAINYDLDPKAPEHCAALGKIEGKEIIPPKILGHANIIRNNGKGDLCPADYPWPPGFRK